MNPEFWRGRRVLITGHTGFKGAWLALCLHQAGAQVAGYALAPATTPSLFEAARVAELIASLTGDVRDFATLTRAFDQHRPEIVIHLAAQSLVRASYADPAATFATNVMGTVNVLEATRRTPGMRAALIVTSDKCYENSGESHPFSEVDRLGGHDPYSASKACAEIAVAAYRHACFAGVQSGAAAIATARAGNVIGGGDWADDRLIPDMVRAYSAGRQAKLRNPASTRPWQHVLDPLNGYLMLAEQLYLHGADYAEAWNFGPDTTSQQRVDAIADRISSLWGQGAAWTVDKGSAPHEALHLGLDSRKSRARLGWVPRIELPKALEQTVRWYVRFCCGEDARELTLEQITAFHESGA